MAKRPVKKVKSSKPKTKPKIVKVKKTKPSVSSKNKRPTSSKKTTLKAKLKMMSMKKIVKPKKAVKKTVSKPVSKAAKSVTPKMQSPSTKPPKKTIMTKTIKPVTSNLSMPIAEVKKSPLPSKPKQKIEIPIIVPPQEEHDENYMNDAQKTHFRQILLNWKQQLLEEMERTVHHMQDDATILPDPNDRATQEEEFSLELRARDRELKLIKKIEEALERIDNSDYGFCEACGVEIGVKRLEARPTATLCIDCKTIDEIREKHFG